MITVTVAPPFATIQDLGRTGYRDSGVPVSGVADRDSALTLNSMLGNQHGAAMMEWAIAGGALRFDTGCTVAVGGAVAECFVNGKAMNPFVPVEVGAGGELRVDRIVGGRFLLVAVRGGINVPVVMGSRSTLLSAALGGLEGRRLRNGDTLLIGDAFASPNGMTRTFVHAAPSGTIGVIRGPQAHLFDEHAWTTFLNADLSVSRASDRTGYRLEGIEIRHNGDATLPSEPTCVGAIQIPGGGAPIVIMNDGPTVGGYPKIAVIRTSCLSRFAQLAPGEKVRFALDE